MKALKIFFLSILGLFLAALIGFVIFLKTLDLNQYLPQITKIASDAMGRNVTIDHAGLNVGFSGVVLDLNGLRIADIIPTAPPLLTADKAQAQVDVGPLLSKRQVQISNITFSTVKISAGNPQLPLTILITKAQAKVDADMDDVNILQLSLHIASGLVNAQAKIKGYRTPNAQLSASAAFSGIRIEELIDASHLPIAVKGQINGNVSVSAQGLAPDVLLKTLKGQGDVNLTGGTIESLRLFEATVGPALGKIPGLSQAIDDIINSTIQSKLGSDTIALDKAQAQFTIADSVVTLDNVVASSRAFELDAKGTVGLDMTTAIAATMLIALDLSADLAKQAKPLAYLQDGNGRIKIDGNVLGVIPKVKFIPSVNVKNVTTNALIEEGSKQLQKVIEKNPEVGSILNSIFGGK